MGVTDTLYARGNVALGCFWGKPCAWDELEIDAVDKQRQN